MDEAVSYRRRTGHIVRSLSAILGAASIPAIFGMGWLVFALGSWSIAAAMMAVSPYGIYLAQEARYVSDFVDHRFPVLPGDTSHPPSDFPTYLYGWD